MHLSNVVFFTPQAHSLRGHVGNPRGSPQANNCSVHSHPHSRALRCASLCATVKPVGHFVHIKGVSLSNDIEVLNSTAQTRLKTIIERIESLESDKEAIAADIKEVYAEAKGEGFAVKIVRRIVKLRKMDKAVRLELDALTDLYLSAIGGL